MQNRGYIGEDIDNISLEYNNNNRANGLPPEPLADYDLDTPAADERAAYTNGWASNPPDQHHVSIELENMDEGGVRYLGLSRTLSHQEKKGDRALHRHRRYKSHHVPNGYDFYKRQLQQHVNHGISSDPDTDSVQSLNFEDLRQTREFLATLRLRTRKKSSKRKATDVTDGDEIEGVGDGEGEDEDEYEETVGMPSAREKLKGLTERLSEAKKMHTAEAVAKQYRDSLWTMDQEAFLQASDQMSRSFAKFRNVFSNAVSSMNFWSQQFKEIEGHFGIATATYFRFLRWLVKINFLAFFLFLCFVYVPQIVYNLFDDYFKTQDFNDIGNASADNFYVKASNCSKGYATYLDAVIDLGTTVDYVLDIAQGTGILEDTMLFYGHYNNLSFLIRNFDEPSFDTIYNMSLAYLLTVGASFTILFIMIVKNSSNTIKETVLDFEHQGLPKYSNSVFGGWDYCISSTKMAFFRQKIIFNEFKADLAELQTRRLKGSQRTSEKSKLILKRVGVNLIVIAILGGSFYTIVWATNYLLDQHTRNMDPIVGLVIQYIPSIIIALLNLIVPEIFTILSSLEEYSQSVGHGLTIIRCVSLRLSLVGVLIVSLYYRLQYVSAEEVLDCPEAFNVTNCCSNALWGKSENSTQIEKGNVRCWESYVGQQFYKLALADFMTVVFVLLLVKLPRRIIYDKLKDSIWLVNQTGKAKFDLPLEVLDIIYTQSLCWIGMFFTPLLPAITFFKVLVYFFIKKIELLYVVESPDNATKASRSYSFFQTVLLISFVVIASLIGYMVGNISPSMSCGPFRVYSSENYVMFDAITTEVASWPDVPQKIFRYFGTAAFHIPAILIVCLAIYYYYIMAQGYKKMEELLKIQLKSESFDKQYLLARVDEIIKKGELIREHRESYQL